MFYEVLLDSGETPNKCTISPLAYRADFNLIRVYGEEPLPGLKAPILLHHEGRCLTELREELVDPVGIASVDCIWNRLDTILKKIQKPLPIFARIPEGFKTVYPRKSKNGGDPECGLATIEAIFTASALLRNWDASLLSEYYFGRAYVEVNRKRFLDLGVLEARDETLFPKLNLREKNSLQRRHARGRL